MHDRLLAGDAARRWALEQGLPAAASADEAGKVRPARLREQSRRVRRAITGPPARLACVVSSTDVASA
jgi:hypothetical protein